VIEGLFKLLLILFLCNICFLQDTVNQSKAVNLNIVPYQENNTILGFNISDDEDYRLSISLQNWFTNNLYLQGILSPGKKSDNLFLNYSLNLGYSLKVNNNVVNDIIFNFGYNKKKYELNDFKNTSIGQITIMNFKPINIALKYNFIDAEENNFHQLGIELFKDFKKKYIIKFGFKFDYGDNENIDSSYLTFNYCI